MIQWFIKFYFREYYNKVWIILINLILLKIRIFKKFNRKLYVIILINVKWTIKSLKTKSKK